MAKAPDISSKRLISLAPMVTPQNRQLMIEKDRIAGSLFGLAFGDALGAPTEFLGVPEILRRWPPDGPSDLMGTPALVTDDTQMALAVGVALADCQQTDDFTPATVEKHLRQTFVEWLNAPDNNRAPGMTCLRACRGLMSGLPWQDATVVNSKGCGANMRVAPVAFLQNVDATTRAAIAQFQAALTHGHATGLAASDLTAYAITDLANGGDYRTLTARLREYAENQRFIYHAEWLGDLWQRPDATSPENFIERGWQECLGVLDRLEAALAHPEPDVDPCQFTGGGWIAEEALGTGLLCYLLFPEEPRRALQRAATTSGDSDSIACLTGAFAGAALGSHAWPAAWYSQIEYSDKLTHLGAALVRE